MEETLSLNVTVNPVNDLPELEIISDIQIYEDDC